MKIYPFQNVSHIMLFYIRYVLISGLFPPFGDFFSFWQMKGNGEYEEEPCIRIIRRKNNETLAWR